MKKIWQSINDSKIVKCIILLTFLVLTFILVLNHEIWTDESQAWEIAKNLSIPDIIKQMQYEGHPSLWHLILSIPAKLGIPVLAMNIISWLLINAACYIIVFHAKWDIIVKILVLFNPTFLFFLPVIARNYCLIPILICLFSIYYPKRHDHPIIYTNILCLLAHTHLVICGFVGMAAIFFIIECIKKWEKLNKKTFTIMIFYFVLYFILLCIQIIPSLSQCGLVGVRDTITMEKISTVLFKFSAYYFSETVAEKLPYLIAIVFIIGSLLMKKNDKKQAVIFIATMVVFTFIHLFWPHVMHERTCIIFAVIVTMNLYNKSIWMQLFISVLALASLNQMHYISFDLYNDFSDTKNTAAWINENVEENSLIIFMNSQRHVSVIPYINVNVDYYNLKEDTAYTFITWKESKNLDVAYTLDKIEDFEESYENIYLMMASRHDINWVSLDSINVVKHLMNRGMLSMVYVSKNDERMLDTFNIYKLIKK